jgi:hypothetical protein
MIRQHALFRDSGDTTLGGSEMPNDEDQREQFVSQLAQQIHRYDLEVERLERMQGIFAAGMIRIERYSQAMNAEIELMKNAIAGVTPHGLEPIPPRDAG